MAFSHEPHCGIGLCANLAMRSLTAGALADPLDAGNSDPVCMKQLQHSYLRCISRPLKVPVCINWCVGQLDEHATSCCNGRQNGSDWINF